MVTGDTGTVEAPCKRDRCTAAGYCLKQTQKQQQWPFKAVPWSECKPVNKPAYVAREKAPPRCWQGFDIRYEPNRNAEDGNSCGMVVQYHQGFNKGEKCGSPVTVRVFKARDGGGFQIVYTFCDKHARQWAAPCEACALEVKRLLPAGH